MIPTTLEEANALVLRLIGEASEEMILGFLPLSESEENAVLKLVREKLHEHFGSSIQGLMLIAPAATTYALAVAPSRSLTEGGKFYPGLRDDLGLEIPVGNREMFTASFLSTCERLGLLTGTIEGTRFRNPAPFIFQAGILHYWKNALAQGLRTTLNVIPAPDLEDEETVARFVAELGKRIHHQPILSRALETPIGPLLVRRLIVAYLQNDDSVLPPHLREPLRESFQTAGRGVVLRGPYLAYDLAFNQIELVLPTQSNRIATPDTCWLAAGRRYAARSESRIPLEELKERRFKVQLQNLAGSFDDQAFHVDTRLDETVPFRIFREDTLRERRSDAGTSCSVPPGSYLVAMAPGVDAGEDEEDVEDFHGCRVLRNVDLRPGDEPVELSLGEQKWDVSCALQSGVFVDRERSSTARLENGQLLHFGSDMGLVAYFPAVEGEEPEFQLEITCEAQVLKQSFALQGGGEKNRVYVFTENIKEPLSAVLSQLPPGIHRIQVTLFHSSRSVEHTFWYWRGLQAISEARGFQCDKAPENIDLRQSKGIMKGSDADIAFQDGYHAPSITIALTQPSEFLVMPRAGVQAVLLTPGDDWEEEPNEDEPVIVLRGDRRVVRFRSGGFQEWEILCGDRKVTQLDRNRTGFNISLAGLCQTFGGSGEISARREDGERIRLFTFSMPLTAGAPKFRQDHGIGVEEWAFSVPTEELHEIGVRLTDLSDRPDGPEGETFSIASAGGDFEGVTQELVPGVSLTTEKSEKNGADFVDVSVKIHTESVHETFFLIDFFRKATAEGSWVPLRCTERHGYSSIRLVVMGGKLPDESATWWQRLRSARRGENQEQTEAELATALESLTIEDLENGLITCRRLLAWKYPTEIWNTSARRLQDLPGYLGRHRFNTWDGTAAKWWEQGAAELSEFAASSQAPVARQLIFGSQPACLRTPSDCTEVANGRHFSTPVGKSLNLAAEIRKANGLLPYAQAAYHAKWVNPLAFHSFENFNAVIGGKATGFGQLDLKSFLNGLFDETEELADTCARVKAESLLSPEHLLVSVRAINRRCRPLETVSSTDDAHPLASIAQLVEKLHQRLPMTMPAISSKLGIQGQFKDPYEEENYVFWWRPPCLENSWGQKVGDLLWGLAGISRLGANGMINPSQFEEWIGDLLKATNERGIQNRICVLLSLAPELFAFYVALFDLAFCESNQS